MASDGGVAISVTVGEIKSSASGVGMARAQLKKALQVLEHAARAYYGDYLAVEIINLTKVGWICLPKALVYEVRRMQRQPKEYVLQVKGF